MWLKEQFEGWQFFTKAIATGLVVAGLILVGMSSEKPGGFGIC